MSQTIIDGVLPKIPQGWRKLKPGTAINPFDRQWDHESAWTILDRSHAARGPVRKFEVIVRKR